MSKKHEDQLGIVFLEIDGLAGKVLKDAMNLGKAQT